MVKIALVLRPLVVRSASNMHQKKKANGAPSAR